MKAIAIQHQHLQLCERPILSPGAGEVLIAVRAAGVNRADLLQVEGLYPPPPGASDLPGLEVSGTITAIGRDVTAFSIGDNVCALLDGGGYAEYAIAPAGQVLPIPAGLSLIEAASLPEACFTVWKNLFFLAKLTAGERVLIHGGTSGIGVMAIQMAHALGAEVYTTVGGDEKIPLCETLGAKKAVNYTHADYTKTLKALTGDKGMNVVLDILGGGEAFQANLSLLAYRGRMVTIGLLSGKQATVNLAPLLLKNLTIFGSTLRSDSIQAKASLAEGLKHHIWPLLVQGKIKPVIDTTFPLEDAKSAHNRMKSRQHRGKIVLEVGAGEGNRTLA